MDRCIRCSGGSKLRTLSESRCCCHPFICFTYLGISRASHDPVDEVDEVAEADQADRGCEEVSEVESVVRPV